jgi:ribosome modulation factor
MATSMTKRANGSKKSKGGRRSKAESMTEADANTTEVRGGELGLPEPVIIASEDFHMHLKAYKSAVEKKDTAVGLVRSVLKGAARTHKELPNALKEAVNIERENDPSKLKARLEILGIALRETGCPVQLSVFDTLAGDVNQQCYKRGYDDGVNGRSANNRYPESSELYEEYARGWRHGTAKNMGVSPEQSDAATEEQRREQQDAEFESAAPRPEGAGERVLEQAH